MTQLFTNNAATATVGAITNVATSITVADGSKFPAPVAPDFALLTLVGLDGNGNENAWEVVKLTERAANVLTVVRGQEGTAAAAWADATRIELRLTAAGMSAKLDADLSTLTDAGALDGTETLPVNKVGTKRTTVQKILDWIAIATTTLTNKTISLASNTLTGTKAQFDTALSDDNFGYLATANTWTAKQTISNNLEFSGNSRRILADFTNATLTNRTVFQTSDVASGVTNIHAIPNGPGRQSGFKAESDPLMAGGVVAAIDVLDTEARITSGTRGGFAFQPLTFWAGGSERVRVSAAGKLEVGLTGNSFGVFIGRADAVNEGGQLELARASDNSVFWSIDVLGATATPDLRFVNSGEVPLTIKGGGNVEHLNFTKLGESSPAVKVKKLTGTTPASQGGTTAIAHGLTGTKILHVNAVVDRGDGVQMQAEHSFNSNHQFSSYWDGTNVHIQLHLTNSANILSKAIRILVTYEE